MFKILWRHFSKETSVISCTRRELFDLELTKQIQFNKRNLEKITVQYKTKTEKVAVTMDKNISTPMDVAKHFQNILAKRSILAFVNDKPYDMNKPLTDNCMISFSDFRSNFPHQANIAFWRSCSFLTNWVLETHICGDFKLNLCSFMNPDLRSGSFVCDFQLLYRGDASFDPTKVSDINLKDLSNAVERIASTPYTFTPLSVSLDVALQIFSDSPIKLRQIPSIAERHRQQHGTERLHLYKVGDHVDICQGPLVPSTAHIGPFRLTCLYPIETADYGRIYRVQGVSVPTQLPTAESTFEMLCQRAEIINKFASIPQLRDVATVRNNKSVFTDRK